MVEQTLKFQRQIVSVAGVEIKGYLLCSRNGCPWSNMVKGELSQGLGMRLSLFVCFQEVRK